MNNRRDLIFLSSEKDKALFYSIIDDSFLFLMRYSIKCSYYIAPILVNGNEKYVAMCTDKSIAITNSGLYSLIDFLSICQRQLNDAEVIKIVDNKTLARGVSLRWCECDKAMQVVRQFQSPVFIIKGPDSNRQYTVNIDDYIGSDIKDIGDSLIFVSKLSEVIK